jgi:hypothetical protein
MGAGICHVSPEPDLLSQPRKIAVIDGRVGQMGGMNIGQEHLDGRPSLDCWRDTQVNRRGGGNRAAGGVPHQLVQRHRPEPSSRRSVPVGRERRATRHDRKCRQANRTGKWRCACVAGVPNRPFAARDVESREVNGHLVRHGVAKRPQSFWRFRPKPHPGSHGRNGKTQKFALRVLTNERPVDISAAPPDISSGELQFQLMLTLPSSSGLCCASGWIRTLKVLISGKSLGRQ